MAFYIGANQPFTDTITGIFSFFLRFGWSDTAGTISQIFTSIGNNSGTKNGLIIYLGAISGEYKLIIETNDASAGTARHEVYLGDDNGTDWIQFDKWYQVGFSISPSGFSYAVNGTTSPTATVISSSNGNLNLSGSSRIMHLSGAAANSALNSANLLLANANWPTFVVGASAWSSTYIDWTNATARGLVFDADGNFNNPGENGSLWFGAYDAIVPEFYFADGSPRTDNGFHNATIPQNWAASSGGGAGSRTAPGGLRKQYERSFPTADWTYLSLPIAEASGDTWLEGDTIGINAGGAIFVYRASLVSVGHSGLIHKDPFGESGTVATATIRSSAGLTDPDTWGYTDTSTGTKGVDYELDTNGGKPRMRHLTGTGKIYLTSNYTTTSADTITFAIVDAIRVTYVPGQAIFAIYLRSHRATNYNDSVLYVYNTQSSVNWSVLDTVSPNWRNTGIKFGTPTRLWIYLKAGKATIYAGSSLVPYSTVNVEVTGAIGQKIGFFYGGTGGQSTNVEMGYHMFGSMTVS